jgi:hypothetical protein
VVLANRERRVIWNSVLKTSLQNHRQARTIRETKHAGHTRPYATDLFTTALRAPQRKGPEFPVPSVETTETLEAWYQACDGNDVPDGFGQ